MLSVDRRGNILIIKLMGELEGAHLDEAAELLDEKLTENENLPLLIDLRQYEGAEDLSTAWRHFRLVSDYGDRVERVAVVGSLDWQKLAVLLVSPFTKAKERFFEPDEVDEALRWLRE
jgi:hypothetical protein